MSSSVDILLSVHNPNPLWLNLLLDSIDEQVTQANRLLLRLDGNFPLSAITLKRNIRIEVLEDKIHLGFAKSFFVLLERSKADYILFCDQDDVWLEDKIYNLLEIQTNSIKPTLTFCGFQVINASGQNLNYTQFLPKKITKYSFLFSNSIPGNTIMINRTLADLVKRSTALTETPKWHDWWCLSIAREFGQISGTNTRDMMYRVHGKNAVGLKIGMLKRLLSLVRKEASHEWIVQVELLLNYLRFTNEFDEQVQFFEGLVLNYSRKMPQRFIFLLRNGITQSDPIDILQALKYYVFKF